VTGSLPQRLLLLGAVALLAAVATLAVVERLPEDSAAFTSAVAPAGWNTAFAGSRGETGDAQRTSCGQVLGPGSLGVTHPVLPCGAKLLVRYGGETILTEVIDNELVATGRQFELTPALAQLVGLDGTQQVEWRYATR